MNVNFEQQINALIINWEYYCICGDKVLFPLIFFLGINFQIDLDSNCYLPLSQELILGHSFT